MRLEPVLSNEKPAHCNEGQSLLKQSNGDPTQPKIIHKNKLHKSGSLARVFELCEPFQRFILEKQSSLSAHFRDKECVLILAYLCDAFNLLNKLNLSVQGRMTTVFNSADKEVSFKARRYLWGQ